jgi:hypothetical protein
MLELPVTAMGRNVHPACTLDGPYDLAAFREVDVVSPGQCVKKCVFWSGTGREPPYRSIAPVAFTTAAITFCPAASISASVNVRSRGWNTTSIASDFLPADSFSPS